MSQVLSARTACAGVARTSRPSVCAIHSGSGNNGSSWGGRTRTATIVTQALDLHKILKPADKQRVDEVIKVTDEKLKTFSDVLRRKAIIIQDAWAKQAEIAAAELQQQTALKAKQWRKQSQKAKVALLVKAEEVAAQAAELAIDELERVTETAPEGIKEIAQTALKSHSEEKAKSGAVIHDFCFGIPYGALLSVGGLLWFTVSGSLHALRFGTLLGGLLLAISVQSLRVWQQGKTTTRYIVAQSGIALAVSLFQFSRFFQTYRFFPTLVTAIASGAMFIFYWYVIGAGGPPPKKEKTVAVGSG